MRRFLQTAQPVRDFEWWRLVLVFKASVKSGGWDSRDGYTNQLAILQVRFDSAGESSLEGGIWWKSTRFDKQSIANRASG